MDHTRLTQLVPDQLFSSTHVLYSERNAEEERKSQQRFHYYKKNNVKGTKKDHIAVELVEIRFHQNEAAVRDG